jgi:hypothetical protein
MKVYLKNYGINGEILWEKNGLYKIEYTHVISKKTEIFTKEEFDFINKEKI